MYPLDLPRKTLAEMASTVANWTESHPDLGIHPESRILRLCRIVQEAAGRITEPDEPTHRELVLAHKDVQELWFIIENIADRLVDEPFRRRFQRTSDDTLRPEEASDQTQGRDTQFELFLAAAAIRAGLDVSDPGSGSRLADWILRDSVSRCSLEAKRLKSRQQAEKRIRRAAEQIENTGIGGILAIDISAVDNPDARPLDHFVPDHELDRMQRDWGDHFTQNHFPRMKAWVASRPVGVFLVYDFILRPGGVGPNGDKPWGLLGIWHSHYLARSGSDNHEHYQRFITLLNAGLPNL
jgi:hypothetical protein